MKSRLAQWRLLWLVGAGAVALGTTSALAQTNPPAKAPGPAGGDKAACKRNLKAINEAIQAYRLDHKDLPNWLSDLVPQYLADVNLLVCPVCRRTGQVEAAPLADPKLPSSYLFEFCPVPLGTAATNAPTRTRREWKRRQMGLAGSVVPLIRCRHHQPVLNLAFDGTIYESPARWELVLTNRIELEELTAARLFADATPPAPAKRARPRFPPRDPQTRKELLNLTPFYNAGLDESWQGRKGNDLASLPKGVQPLAGVAFDLRGIVQLRSQSSATTNFPQRVTGIPVRRKCQRVHFLHAAGFGTLADEGKQLGTYVVHYTTHQMRLELPIRYGLEVRNWRSLAGEPAAPAELTAAWEGKSGAGESAQTIRLFLTTWVNVAPEVEIESIDYVSEMARPAPFLVAITVE